MNMRFLHHPAHFPQLLKESGPAAKKSAVERYARSVTISKRDPFVLPLDSASASSLLLVTRWLAQVPSPPFAEKTFPRPDRCRPALQRYPPFFCFRISPIIDLAFKPTINYPK
jgi:hypothetical protein